MSDIKDRIRLAEAMGWIHTTGWSENPMSGKQPFDHWSQRGGKVYGYLPFNPFTDANDDYAVLEWMRRGDGPATTYAKFKDAFRGRYVDLVPRWYLYEVGDYARAALKVLAATEQGKKDAK